MADLLLDTDVFVDHLRGARRLGLGRNAGCYSVVTRAELYAGASGDEAAVETILRPFREYEVDRQVAQTAGRLRRASGTLLPDALIAATALEHGLTLVTRNIKDFDQIPKLRVREPA